MVTFLALLGVGEDRSERVVLGFLGFGLVGSRLKLWCSIESSLKIGWYIIFWAAKLCHSLEVGNVRSALGMQSWRIIFSFCARLHLPRGIKFLTWWVVRVTVTLNFRVFCYWKTSVFSLDLDLVCDLNYLKNVRIKLFLIWKAWQLNNVCLDLELGSCLCIRFCHFSRWLRA